MRWLAVLVMLGSIAHADPERPPEERPCKCLEPTPVGILPAPEGSDDFTRAVRDRANDAIAFGDEYGRCLRNAGASSVTVRMHFRRGRRRPTVRVPRGDAGRCLAFVSWGSFPPAPRTVTITLEVTRFH
jgi:hypothetical protein